MKAANCLICAAPLVYSETACELTCDMCGKRENGHAACEAGHYVCDACHREQGVNYILQTCKTWQGTNPIELAQHLMTDKSIYPNGPEHHSLVGASLLTCYKNAGGKIDLDTALAELRARSMQVPGGACGYWGTCGAAISAGQYFAIISGSSPLEQDAWGKTARLVSNIIGLLADVGGPRCCKRTSFTALEEAARYTADVLEVHMQLPDHTTCTFMGNNAECRKRACPYFDA